jgi:hypothetical protein
MSRTEEEYSAMRDVASVCMQRHFFQAMKAKMLFDAGEAMLEFIKANYPDSPDRQALIDGWEKAKQPPQL